MTDSRQTCFALLLQQSAKMTSSAAHTDSSAFDRGGSPGFFNFFVGAGSRLLIHAANHFCYICFIQRVVVIVLRKQGLSAIRSLVPRLLSNFVGWFPVILIYSATCCKSLCYIQYAWHKKGWFGGAAVVCVSKTSKWIVKTRTRGRLQSTGGSSCTKF